jgi:hypothetical protein
MDFDMEIQHSQLKINHLSDTTSTKAAGGRIFSGVFTQGRQGTTQGQEDFELSWYLFFQHIRICMEVLLGIGSGRSDHVKPRFDINQFGSLYFGFMQSLNVSKSSNSGGTPVMKFEPTP